MSGRLLVSISSVFDKTLQATRDTLAVFDREGVPVSLLIAPHIDGDWHLARDRATLEWLRAEAAGGRSFLLNGFDQAVQGRRAEFADLPAHEARLRLTGATRQMESLGLFTDCFAPPRWRLSAGTLDVASGFGFRVVGSTKGVWVREIADAAHGTAPSGSPAHGTAASGASATAVSAPPAADAAVLDDAASPAGWQLRRSRNLSVGEGFGAPGWWRRNIIKAARRGARKGNTVRLSASARNLREGKVARDFVAAALGAVEAGARPATYAELAG